MENELTFVAPEGVYSVTEDHRPIPAAHDALALNNIHSFTRVYVKDQLEPSQTSFSSTNHHHPLVGQLRFSYGEQS